MLPDREFIYTAVTNNIRVVVHPLYLEAESDPEQFRYVFGYTVTIENEGKETVQLLSREWEIIDGRGQKETITGDGVVGEQPIIRPDNSHRYSSHVVLRTPSGLMSGTYQMQGQSGFLFKAKIPVFSLDMPDRLTTLH